MIRVKLMETDGKKATFILEIILYYCNSVIILCIIYTIQCDVKFGRDGLSIGNKRVKMARDIGVEQGCAV